MFKGWRELFGGAKAETPSDEAPKPPVSRGERAIRYATALSAMRARAVLLKPGEKEELDSEDLTMGRPGYDKTATVQGIFTLDQLPQVQPALEEAFRAHLRILVEGLQAHPSGIQVQEGVFMSLERVAEAKGTNLRTIITAITGKAVIQTGTVLELLSHEEAMEMLRGR